jgi:hypothetical protein
MMKCQGTSKEEALENQRLREAIASDERISSTFGTFILEDGCGKITLDVMKAYDHVRYVLNDIRRAKGINDSEVPSPANCKEKSNLIRITSFLFIS